MSDAPRQAEREQAQQPAPAVSDTWGDDISEECKAQLQARLQVWASGADRVMQIL
jgi:hypothetical protein